MRFQWIEMFMIVTFIVASYSFSFTEDEIKNHDGLNTGKENYCVTCHTPRNYSATNRAEPRWFNKTEKIEFQTYASDNPTAQSGFPTGESKLCLGCHDGIVATEDKNVYVSSNPSNSLAFVTFSSHNSHPVSIIYNSTLAYQNNNLADPSVEPSGLGGTIEEDLLENGRIVCTSCHNIHPTMENEYNTSNHFNNGGKNFSLSLKIPNDNSALCLTCHKK